MDIPNKEEIAIKVEVRNTSNTSVKTFKHRRLDYKYEKIKSLGNYIVEIEKYENGQYSLFSPSTDINPIFENQEYISFTNENSITDTLYIDGCSFSRSNESKRGFS